MQMNVCFTHGHRGAPAVSTVLISHWRVCVFWGWRVWPGKRDKRYLFLRQDFRKKFSPLNASYVTHKQWQGTSDWILSVQYSRPADFLQGRLIVDPGVLKTLHAYTNAMVCAHPHTHACCACTDPHIQVVYALTHTCMMCMHWHTHTYMLCTHGHTRACCGMHLPTHKHIHKISKPDVIIFFKVRCTSRPLASNHHWRKLRNSAEAKMPSKQGVG